ncbi:MAG: hypothetical protein LBB30_05060 [Candidatus Methanoplasma sp.]|jgi:hypothetical protein|nr:hypothetical protein [Candidatus Methanoplasma sp.]
MIAAIAVFAMVFAAGVVLLCDSSDVDGANSYIKGETNVVKTGGSLTYQIMFFESEEFDTLEITYSAVLKDSGGTNQAGSVSPSSGALVNGIETDLTVKAPATAGKYTLVVTFTENKDEDDKVVTEKTQTITVTQPIKLTTVLKNDSKVDFTDFAVYFVVDGKLVEGSKTLVSIASGSTATASYEWATEQLPNGEHTFKVVAGEENIGDYKDVITWGEGKFYVGHSDFGLYTILIAIVLILLIIVVIYLYRKPVKNYGKPKSRR